MSAPRWEQLCRLIDERAPCDIDLLRVLRKARERGCFVELNAQPERLDLDDNACRMAKDEGVLVCVNSDVHEFDDLRFGVGQARRGWAREGRRAEHPQPGRAASHAGAHDVSGARRRSTPCPTIPPPS